VSTLGALVSNLSTPRTRGTPVVAYRRLSTSASARMHARTHTHSRPHEHAPAGFDCTYIDTYHVRLCIHEYVHACARRRARRADRRVRRRRRAARGGGRARAGGAHARLAEPRPPQVCVLTGVLTGTHRGTPWGTHRVLHGLLAVEGGLAPGAHTLVSLSLDRHRSVYSQGYSRVLRGKGKVSRAEDLWPLRGIGSTP
jgi:hypothetical protein